MTINREHLAPCPFCAGAEIVDADYGQEYWCQCRNCGCRTGNFGSRAVAVLHWNTRAQAQAAPEAEPVAWMLADAVGGSMLEFQHDLLLENQCRYGGQIVPLYTAPQHDADHIPDTTKMVDAELVEVVLPENETAICSDRRIGPVLWFGGGQKPGFLYTAQQYTELVGLLERIAGSCDPDCCIDYLRGELTAKLATLSAKNEGGKA